MSFQIQNNIALINGTNGRYDKKVKNPDIRYGRNVMANYTEYSHNIGKIPKLPVLLINLIINN